EEFDTCHGDRDGGNGAGRLPFPTFYSSVLPGGSPMRRSSPGHHPGRVRRVVAAAASAALLAGGIVACSSDGPDDTLQAFLTGWRKGKLDPVGFVTPDGSKIAATKVYDALQNLTGDLTKAPLVLAAQGTPKITGDIATTSVRFDW